MKGNQHVYDILKFQQQTQNTFCSICVHLQLGNEHEVSKLFVDLWIFAIFLSERLNGSTFDQPRPLQERRSHSAPPPLTPLPLPSPDWSMTGKLF